MNSDTTFTLSTDASDGTKQAGERLGRMMKGGEVVELLGDIGAGKTTFTQGLAKGMGCREDIVSPTFTLSRQYPAHNNLSLHHFDFYRLEGTDLTGNQLSESIKDPMAVVVIEWAGNGKAYLPPNRVQVNISLAEGENMRTITVGAIGEGFDHIIKELKLHGTSA